MKKIDTITLATRALSDLTDAKVGDFTNLLFPNNKFSLIRVEITKLDPYYEGHDGSLHKYIGATDHDFGLFVSAFVSDDNGDLVQVFGETVPCIDRDLLADMIGNAIGQL